MPNGVGFPTYPQRPTVPRQEVGARLMQAAASGALGGRPGAAPPVMPASEQSPTAPPMGMRPHAMTASVNAEMPTGSAGGGMQPAETDGDANPSMMSHRAFGQPAAQPPSAHDGVPGHPAIEQALLEAKQRIANGISRGLQPNPAAPNQDRQLSHLGLSPEEIGLLKVSGGIR